MPDDESTPADSDRESDAHPWDVPFDWDDFVVRWVTAVDACDDATLLRWATVDCVTARVGSGRTQSSRDGLVELVHAVAVECPGAVHEWRIVTRTEHEAVVDWTRSDARGAAVASGLWFLRVRPGANMLESWRWFETPR